MSISEGIVDSLLVLQQGIKGGAGFRAVLDALFDVNIVYGHVLKGATMAYQHSWFISEAEERKKQLSFILCEMIVWIYRTRPLPAALLAICAEDPAYLAIFAGKNVIPLRPSIPTAPEDYSSLENLKELYEFFFEELPGPVLVKSPVFANAPC